MKNIFLTLCLLLAICLHGIAVAQQGMLINLSLIDGVPITPDNIFNYQVHTPKTATVKMTGTIRYRGSNMSLSYSFSYSLHQGMNSLSADAVHPQWQFSSSALKELFMTYKVLPEGTYEYCVVITDPNAKEAAGPLAEECLYHRSSDIFLINLVDPENNAKLHVFNPVLTWVANYPFASELTYRIRVAEIKQGQNTANAVMRNQPIFDESNLSQNSIVYPVYTKPLEVNKPYAWTVDAYYKGILLGGAEPWRFIIPDSTPVKARGDRSYIDIAREKGDNRLFAVGSLKLKYVLEDHASDVLSLELVNENDKKMKLTLTTLNATYGDNRFDLDLAENSNLKHEAHYILKITTKTGRSYKLPFQYLNPEFLSK